MDILEARGTSFKTNLTDGELQLFEICLAYALGSLSTADLEDMTGFDRNKLETVWHTLYSGIIEHCDPKRLPERYKNNLAEE